MTTPEGPIVFDVRFLYDATRKLHGYLLHNWFTKYLALIVENTRRLMKNGVLGPEARPTPETDYAVVFDIHALDLEKLTFALGFYFYILSSHKKANYYLMQENDRRRVLYLQGFDYYGAVRADGGAAMGFSALHTKQFSWRLGERLGGGDIDIFKPLSPEDLFWETAGATHLFYGDFEHIIHMASEPIRSFHVNANDWQDEISRLVDRMDYFVVYVSSLTPSVLWELELLERKQRAQYATVVFDAEAIENKELQIRLQGSLEETHAENMLWTKATDGAALSAEEVREQLARSFVVLSPDEFDAKVDEIKDRIAEASAPVGPGAREAPLDFRFHPAVEADELQRIRDFDDELGDQIRRLVSSRSITNLPWFLNQVQLKIFTTLMLGDHDGTGRALAIYAAVVDTVRIKVAGGDKPDGDVADENEREFVDRMTQHYDTGAYVGHVLLSYGQSHEFGDYRTRAKQVYDELFAATTAAVDDFFDEVDRRPRA